MLDGGTGTGGLYPHKHGLYVHAGNDAGINVPACAAGNEVFPATSKMGADTQTIYRNRMFVPLFPYIGVSATDMLSLLDNEL